MKQSIQTFFVLTLFLLTPLSGCFGEDDEENTVAQLKIDDTQAMTAQRGQYYTLLVESTVDWTISRSPGAFFQDEFGVLRDDVNYTLPATQTNITMLILDSERDTVELNISAGDQMWNTTLVLEDSQELMLVDGRRAYDTIDMLTSSYNNRWCGSASVHEGGAAYEAAAEAMAENMRGMGFDFVEVTRYDDDPDQLNVVGYNYGRVNPDEYIVIGGHFDIAYVFTPPGGGTNEGANDDTSGSTVSLEMAQALAQMEFDHTVVAALWACEEEGLLGSLAYVEGILTLPTSSRHLAVEPMKELTMTHPVQPYL